MGRKPTEFNAFDVELPKDTVIMKQNTVSLVPTRGRRMC